jgi:hypothetical protein
LVTRTNEVKPLSRKKRKLEREFQKQMLKQSDEESKKRLRNKLKNEKRRTKNKENMKANKTIRDEPERTKNKENMKANKTIRDEPEKSEIYGDRWDQLKAEQKPGVLFPHDSCSSKDLTPEFEATALTQYTLKRGLKEFGIDGLTDCPRKRG